LKQYSSPAQIKQTLHTEPGITYDQITKQNSNAATNIEQDQHINQPLQQASDDLKNMIKSLFEQMGTMLMSSQPCLLNLNNG
jgi:cobalamin biosynthesis Co2+ chelatase CbiK